jgi:hypothetical protein
MELAAGTAGRQCRLRALRRTVTVFIAYRPSAARRQPQLFMEWAAPPPGGEQFVEVI